MIMNTTEIDLLLRGRKMKKMIDDMYRDLRNKYGLKQIEVDVLMYKAKYPDKVSSEIANDMFIPKGHVSLAMSGLTEKGYLEGTRDPHDRRVVRFSITRKGNEIVKIMREIKNDFNNRLLEGLTEKEINEFVTLCGRLLDNADKIVEEII